MLYREHAPPPRLAHAVRCFWTLRGNGASPSPERILPDGSFELVLHLGDPFVQHDQMQPRAMIVGEIRRPTLVHASARADVFGVRFHPGGAATLLRSLRELRDRIVPLDDVVRDLHERLALASTTAARIGII